jgi:hypothetical protein
LNNQILTSLICCLNVIVKSSDQLEKQNNDNRLKLKELVKSTGIEADPL